MDATKTLKTLKILWEAGERFATTIPLARQACAGALSSGDTLLLAINLLRLAIAAGKAAYHDETLKSESEVATSEVTA